ncbi:hypothetical protein GOB94_10785 [Granulicella sp. 5B5]|uniref:SLBB domain-containing protein n=1 Tax=Granulicella sp. 5B5 TaxID=1617967 RepID=UPI0015F6510E|nr:SLBB domain-containing protein [Granulicella sp. 5B5]QMV19109.1 hypothetical protein GOB94_10785 [Granulicella sp. 5B5]
MKLFGKLSPPLAAAVFMTALGASQARSQVVGGSVQIGPANPTYFQPKLAVDEPLLASLMSVVPGPIVIAPDDTLHISLDGASTYTTDVRVERDGTIQLSYLTPLRVTGLTVEEAERAINGALVRNNLVLNPAVKVVLAKQPSSVVVVNGEVLHPGAYPTLGGLTLDRAIAASGGLLSGASPYVVLTRKGLDEPIMIPLGSDAAHSRYGDMQMLNGDKLQILRVGNYYVVGAVKNQGAYPLKGTTPTTVGEALAAAGGYGFEAILNSTTIARTEGNHRVLLTVPAAKILAGKAPDVALMNDDIVFVPTSKTKAAIKGGASGLIVSLASTYIYAHP